MEIPKDLYDELTKYADDSTILKMIQVNKKYNDPTFFKKIIKRKYPLLEKYKRPDESTKMLYLRMIHYILKLEEDFDMKYHPIPSFNPEDFYNNMRLLSEMFYRFKNLPVLDGSIRLEIKITNSFNKFPLNPIIGEVVILKSPDGNFILYKIKNLKHMYYDELNRMPTIKKVSELLIDEALSRMDLYNDEDDMVLQFKL